jgi:hypothetical protein
MRKKTPRPAKSTGRMFYSNFTTPGLSFAAGLQGTTEQHKQQQQQQRHEEEVPATKINVLS